MSLLTLISIIVQYILITLMLIDEERVPIPGDRRDPFVIDNTQGLKRNYSG